MNLSKCASVSKPTEIHQKDKIKKSVSYQNGYFKLLSQTIMVFRIYLKPSRPVKSRLTRKNIK